MKKREYIIYNRKSRNSSKKIINMSFVARPSKLYTGFSLVRGIFTKKKFTCLFKIAAEKITLHGLTDEQTK